MNEAVRTVRVDEWTDFIRFLERCYGHRWNYFPATYPELYRTDEDALSCFLVLEKEGRIVSHVGLFPLEVSSLGMRMTVGGIGGVATLPEHRRKGYMSMLLNHAAELMKERGWPLSVLWGDRQRYYSFGWERAGLKYSMTITRRALDRANVKSNPIRETSPEDALETVRRLHAMLPMRVERKRLLGVLRKPHVRIWLGEDGYVISSGSGYDPPDILEVASEGGGERELVRAVMERCFQNSATIRISAFDKERLNRLLTIASNWGLEPEGQFRIISLTGLLNPFSRILSERAGNLRDFHQSVGLRFSDTVDTATLSLTNRTFHVTNRSEPGSYLELNECEGVRLFLGGPQQPDEHARDLTALLPLPVHIPELDHV